MIQTSRAPVSAVPFLPVEDAEEASGSASVAMWKKLHEDDCRQLEELKNHVFGMIAKSNGGK